MARYVSIAAESGSLWMLVALIDSRERPHFSFVSGQVRHQHLVPIFPTRLTSIQVPVEKMAGRSVFAAVQRIVAAHYGLTIQDLVGKDRARYICIARHLAMALIRELSDASAVEIGRWFHRHHATVLNALRRIAHSRSISAELDKTFKSLRVLVEKYAEAPIIGRPVGEE